MMNLRKHLHSAILGWGIALALTVLVPGASAQQGGATDPQNPDLTRQELASFDVFLDQHPDIDRQLRANPSLVNNADFIEDHPELGKFLASHAEISEEIKENPTNFMHRERRFDNAENRMRNPNPDVTRGEVAAFDQFLDKHPDIDKQLEANPSLINNADFLKDHPELGKFMASHTEISEEIKENPTDFMRREQRFDNAENRRHNANPDVTRKEVASFDHFLDKHPDIDKQLEANPSLINNADFVEDNPALGKFLADHKDIREEIKENPSDFMRREQHFDNAENRMRNPNPDVTRKEVASFDHFLDKHPDIDKQLDANPGLINDQQFLDHHHDLRAFLKDHPEVREELHENAADFMRRERRFDAAESDRSRSQLDAKNPDLTRKQLAAMDDFLDHHKNIAKDLQRDPNLVNDAKFVKDHNDLKRFMEKNPGVSEELKENPTDFMRQEARLERMDRDHHRHDKDARADKDKHKHKMTAEERKSGLEEKEKLQTVNPH